MGITKAQAGKWGRIALIVIAIGLLLPPLQVLSVKVINPPWSPMQIQRAIESAVTGPNQDWHAIRWMKLSQIPVQQIHFIWASEDQNFFKHHGFDLPEIRRAMDAAQDGGGKVRGASTISMQCARTVFLWQGRSYLRKALEAYYTFWMETLLSKQRILELYLNHIELGPGVYGIGEAAHFYFQKDPTALSRTQMIGLAAILPNPREWSPVHPSAVVQKKMRRVDRLASRSTFPVAELR